MQLRNMFSTVIAAFLAATLLLAASPSLSFGASLDDGYAYTVKGYITRHPDRYATALWSSYDRSRGYIVATGEDFADALSSSALAGLLGYSLLYTSSCELDLQTQAHLLETGIAHVIIVGGEAAVSQDVAESISEIPTVTAVTRIAGANRYATAEAVYRYGESVHGWDASNAVVVSGSNFADAASASVFASRKAAPVLLADASGFLSSSSVEVAKAFDHILIAGGNAAVSEQTESLLSQKCSVTRVGGADRYETSAKLSGYFETLTSSEGLPEFAYGSIKFVTGKKFADALACGTNFGMKARWEDSSFGQNLTYAPMIMLIDDGCADAALAQLKSVGPYSDDSKSVKRFGAVEFIGGGNFEEQTILDVSDGFGVHAIYDTVGA